MFSLKHRLLRAPSMFYRYSKYAIHCEYNVQNGCKRNGNFYGNFYVNVMPVRENLSMTSGTCPSVAPRRPVISGQPFANGWHETLGEGPEYCCNSLAHLDLHQGGSSHIFLCLLKHLGRCSEEEQQSHLPSDLQEGMKRIDLQ
ncbi:hypothetical protein PV11_01425 [Exophiala sideris]|uniref:Uncharacterized protein n=1 Tax=Exophiala sideris TaxID=1016849 RepID=A0A0D1XD19_9EURO|nr:hypothetical protein PV11_01425 [Exophiala sideris]